MKTALARLVSSSTAVFGVGMLAACALLNEHALSEGNQISLTAVASMVMLAYGAKETGRQVSIGRKP